MTWQQLCKLAARLAGVTVDIWYGTPALKVGGKGFVRLKEDGQAVVFVLDSVDTQEALIAARPELYFITDHYRGYAAVLARLGDLSRADAMERLEHAWRQKAGKALRAACDGTTTKPRGRTRTDRARRAAGVRSRR